MNDELKRASDRAKNIKKWINKESKRTFLPVRIKPTTIYIRNSLYHCSGIKFNLFLFSFSLLYTHIYTYTLSLSLSFPMSMSLFLFFVLFLDTRDLISGRISGFWILHSRARVCLFIYYRRTTETSCRISNEHRTTITTTAAVTATEIVHKRPKTVVNPCEQRE